MAAVDSQKERRLTAHALRDALAYDAETGVFRWRHDRGTSRARAGDVAGCVSHKRGYRTIRVNYNRFLAHRLAWLHVHGDWPNGEIDHINGNADDNSIANLRVVTRQQNVWNSGTHSHNSFGLKNIRPKGRKFQVHFAQGNKRVYHKSFPTLDAAIAARDSTAAALYGEFACTGR